MLESDLNKNLEATFGLKAYPFTIPASATLPAIVYREIDNSRDSDSNLKNSNIRSLIVQVTVVSKNVGDTINYKDAIVKHYDDFSGCLVVDNPTVKIMIARIKQSIPLYDSSQRVYEYNIDISFKVKNI